MVRQATGCTVTFDELIKDREYDIRDYGAAAGGNPVENTQAINEAVRNAHQEGGGTVVIPAGEFASYTIRLLSNVNIRFEERAIIRAARCQIDSGYELQSGEGGNYDEPEVNLYAGIQDHGHTYFANSLVYGADIENVMIYGKGLFDGSYIDDEGYVRYALLGGDPRENEFRNEKGHDGNWFGNKGIALVRCRNVVFRDFSMVDCGHFAIIAEGVNNLLVDSVMVDTTRDAFDVDCCSDVTVVNSWFNSLTDDALVLKASYGAGEYMPLKNVLIEDCRVTGYDAGSVYAGLFTTDKLVAEDCEGPTGRVKLGTESTCGYEQVTVRRTHFDRSRGFALEAVDTSDLTDILFTDSTMENISSSPIFIKAGDRGRIPVTGNSMNECVYAKDNVRLDNTGWIIPDKEGYQRYPAGRYVPSYNYTKKVSVDGKSFFNIVDSSDPVRLNPANYYEDNGHYYQYRYEEGSGYVPDYSKEIQKKELCLYANAVGSNRFAKVKNIEISNITVKNADPRYPIEIMGMDSCHIENVVLSNIDVEYRGGITMEMAVEQRQLNTNWEYSQFGARPSVQRLPWLVNTFFLKNEGLLPRVDWNDERGEFVPSPYNVPELSSVYPEPANWGILPAYGLYARHVDGLKLENVSVHYIVEDERPAFVFDDVQDAFIEGCQASLAENVPMYVTVENKYKRPTNLEYVPDMPYHKTDCHITFGEMLNDGECMKVTVNAPAPGTPADSLYRYNTIGIPENGYSYDVLTDDYELPRTVNRPYFMPVKDFDVETGSVVEFDIVVRNPVTDSTQSKAGTMAYSNKKSGDYSVAPQSGTMYIQCENLPDGAVFDVFTGRFVWTPENEGEYQIVFVADDGVIPIGKVVKVNVKQNY